ncbi:hypothetical protein GEMRC1_006253 [Eukaryota sp. GEM-RC1]
MTIVPCPGPSTVHIHLQQSLLSLIIDHLLKLLLKSSLNIDHNNPRRPLRQLTHELPTIVERYGYLSQRFFECVFASIRLVLETNTFSVVHEDLSKLSSITSFLRAKLQSVFLHISAHLFFFPRLQQLDVDVESFLFKSFVELLKGNTTITKINLAYNSIDGENAIFLSDALKINSTIKILNLEGNSSIGSRGAAALAEAFLVNTTLTEINLVGNLVRAEGALLLSEALKVNSVISKINLRHNFICDEGAIALADLLKVNHSITEINLASNSIGDEGVLALAEALSVNTTVTMMNLLGNIIAFKTKQLLLEDQRVQL